MALHPELPSSPYDLLRPEHGWFPAAEELRGTAYEKLPPSLFLVITPNIIVLDRLRADFDGLRIFFRDLVLPQNGYDGRSWREDFQVMLHLQGFLYVNQDAFEAHRPKTLAGPIETFREYQG